eukprot:8241250-Heterocapsa_arctica.AAC.1
MERLIDGEVDGASDDDAEGVCRCSDGPGSALSRRTFGASGAQEAGIGMAGWKNEGMEEEETEEGESG